MSNLIRWDPFRETLTLRNMLDRWMDQVWTGEVADPMNSAWNLAIDINETDDDYIVKASLPGINPEDLDITFSNGMLTIRGEVKEDHQEKEGRYHLRERMWGSFSRSLRLPGGVNNEAIQASYDAGVLTLYLPKAEEAKPRRIQVKKDQKMIEGKLTDIKNRN